MNKILLSGLVFTILLTLQLNAQHHAWCGITPEGQSVLKQKRDHAHTLMNNNMVSTRTGELWMPLKIHVVANNDGTGKVVYSKVYDMLCELNEAYLDQEIQFFVQGDFNVIESSSLYENPNVPPNQPVNSSALGIMNSNRDPNAINIFIVKEIPSNSSGDILGFYDPNRDWLVLQKNQVSSFGASTVIHEMGHFFTLDHPFYGWESGYDVSVNGDIAPTNSPGGVPTEFVNGNNCQTAGDGICDTPPSYNTDETVNNCTYTGIVKDPNEVPIDPLEENIMDYFIGCAESFTAGQKAMMAVSVNNRPNLHTNLAPDVTPLPNSIVQIYPINEEKTDAYTVVGFSWEAVPGATGYLVEVDKTSSFILNPSFKHTSGTYVEFEGIFNANTNYYWRVKALKEGYYCSTVSNAEKFRAGDGSTATNNIKEVLDWKISPNPVNAEQTLNINLETVQSFDATISIYNLSGQRIRIESPTFSLGNTTYELSVADLNEGMYILSIESESGVLNEKIVVTR